MIGDNAGLVLSALIGYITWRKARWVFEKAFMMKQMWSATGDKAFRVGKTVIEESISPRVGLMDRIKRMGRGLSYQERMIDPSDDGPTSSPSRRGKGSKGGGGSSRGTPAEASKQARVFRAFPSAGQILSIGAALIMFGGALWVTSKAFQNFSDEVNWGGAVTGIATIFSMAYAVKILAAGITIAAKPLLAASLIIAALGGSMWIVSKAFQNFSSALEPLIGANLVKLGLGLAAIGAGMAVLSSGQILGAFGALSSFLSGSVISRIGKDAEKYGDPIERLAKSFDMMANALERIVKVSEGVKRIDFEGMAKDLGSVADRKYDTGSKEQNIPLNNFVRIDIDGKKVADAIYRSTVRG